MSGSLVRNVVLGCMVAASAVLVVGSGPLSLGQEAKEKKAKGRLPTYYADLVTGAQREKIYAVQAKYAKEIDELQQKLDSVTKKRDAEIESLLDDKQKAKLKKAMEEGAAKKKKAAAEKKSDEKGK